MSAPLVIGHRGFPHRYPDNSLDGVRAALDLGADGVEVDVRPCGADLWLVHHDRSSGGRPVLEWTPAEAAERNVPTLEQVVEVVPGDCWLFVEIKPLARALLRARIERLRALLLPRAATTRIISQSPAVLQAVERELPGIARSWVFQRLERDLPRTAELSPHHTLVERLVGAGLSLHPWTVNRPERMRVLAALGVASITTNRTDLAVEALRG